MPSQPPSLPPNIGYSHVLQQALQLGNNPKSFARLRNDIRSISRRHLKQSERYARQKSASKLVEESLTEKYPDFFAGEDNKIFLDYAMMYIQQYHNRQRKPSTVTANGPPARQESVQIKPEKALAPGKENDLAEVRTSSEAAGGTAKTPLVERMAQNLALYSDQLNSSAQNTQLQTPKSQLRARPFVAMPSISRTQSGSVAPTESLASVSASKRSRFVSNHQPSFSQSASSSSGSQLLSPPSCAQPAFGSSQSSSSPRMVTTPSLQSLAVHQFLNSCVPSMGHLLDRFINFGCTSEEFLFGISMWPRAEIEHFLDQLPVTVEGMPLSPMEKLVLINQFLNYFS